MGKKTNKKRKSNKQIMNNIKFNECSNQEYYDFIHICQMTQKQLKTFVYYKLKSYEYEPEKGDGWVFAEGKTPILLTAHLDTVHKVQMYSYMEYENSKKEHILTASDGIGGDDRCGVYMILELIRRGFRPSILFCEDEEKGGIGSDKFIETETAKKLAGLNYMIELDRANSKDAVFYECDNKDFTEYITSSTGYKETYGSFSDISTLAPFAGIAAVNLSCGYYNAHTVYEEVNMEEMFHTIDVVGELLKSENEDSKQFEYIPEVCSAISSYYGYDSYCGYDYGEWFEPDATTELYIIYAEDNEEKEVLIEGYSESDAWTNFFMTHGDICYNDVLDYYVSRN